MTNVNQKIAVTGFYIEIEKVDRCKSINMFLKLFSNTHCCKISVAF